ncbi:MAG: SH3 domain-containing protein, partial [Chloroflexota bacterium]
PTAREPRILPSPTPTRSPLQYEVPTYAQELGLEPVCDVSAETHLNVRTGPGIIHDIVTSVMPNTRLNVIGTDDTGDWLEVRYQGLNGWVSADFVLGLSACVNLN